MAHPIVSIYKEDPRYPALLATISDPPEQLYCRGNIDLLKSFCVAFVGTRKASDYGKQAARDLAGALAVAGATIVSGLAAGIDTVAHQATLDAGGSTIAVFGTGPDDASIFPQANVPLVHAILDAGGLVISEYPAGMPGQRYTFPARNRIISGLSKATVVVEADMKSGSLITAKSALEQSRDVYAVPGGIYWPRSMGSNWLIQQGARPLLSASELIEAYELGAHTQTKRVVSTSDPIESAILTLLDTNGPTHMDTIAAQCDCEPSRTMATLTLLELKGLIRGAAGTYSRT